MNNVNVTLKLEIPVSICAHLVSANEVKAALQRELDRVLNEASSVHKAGAYERKCFIGELFFDSIGRALSCVEHDNDLYEKRKEGEKNHFEYYKMKEKARTTASLREGKVAVSVTTEKEVVKKKKEVAKTFIVNSDWLPAFSDIPCSAQIELVAKHFGGVPYYGGVAKIDGLGKIQSGHWVKVKACKSEIENYIKFIHSEAGKRHHNLGEKKV